MPWPNVTDYTDAIQNPKLCFRDQDLCGGEAEADRRGRKLVWSGNFASVYKVSCNGAVYAVRCFTRPVNNQQARYDHLHAFLQGSLPPAFVEFEFHPEGIMVRGEWYPIIKMDWVNGNALDKYVRNQINAPVHLNAPGTLSRIVRRWKGVADSLQHNRVAIAHNDLQHGNIMVQDDGTIRLVDYDGVFLPQYQGERSPEIGHQNFQHPQRDAGNYNERIDNFPAFVIYLSLRALAAQPDLWQQFNNDDNLILKKSDYQDPANSDCFRALRNNPDDDVRNLAVKLEEYCALPVEQVPDLESILSGGNAAPPPPPAPQPAPAPRPAPGSSSYRDLLQSGQAAPPPPAPLPIGAVACPQCGHMNLNDLIYCDQEKCCATLQPGSRPCAYCGIGGPVNAAYCHDCGRKAA